MKQRLRQMLYCLLFRYKLMLDCWNMTPSHRPGFKAIREELEARLMQSSNYLYLEQADTGPQVTTAPDTGSKVTTAPDTGSHVTTAPDIGSHVSMAPESLVTSSDPGSGYWIGDQPRTEDDEYLAPKT